jgi:hypothetical protein
MKSQAMPPAAATRVREFLLLQTSQHYCDECLARVMKLGVSSVQRTTRGLAKEPGFRRHLTECSRCARTSLATTALWAGV